MRRPGPILLAALLCAGAQAGATPAPDHAAAAEVLFQEARDLMDRGEIAAACPKFEASLELDEALGTLLNLATCYEKTGRTASAWARYRQAAEWGRQRGDVRRTALADASAAALEPALPRLTVRLERPAPAAAVTVRRDGTPIDAAAFGVAIPVDPGAHALEAHAAGRPAWRHTVTVVAGQSAVAVIPAAWLDSTVAAPESAAVTAAPVSHSPSTWQRPAAIALVATGVALAATGVYFGRRAARTADDIEAACRPAAPCEWADLRGRDARVARDARLQWILLGAGAAAVAGGATVFFIGGAAGETSTAALGMRGRF